LIRRGWRDFESGKGSDPQQDQQNDDGTDHHYQ